MSTKGYVFCFLMAVLAVTSWIRPVMPATAAVQPAYEYTIMPVQLGEDAALSKLNTAGAKGWRNGGGICIQQRRNDPRVNMGAPFCDYLLLVRERR